MEPMERAMEPMEEEEQSNSASNHMTSTFTPIDSSEN